MKRETYKDPIILNGLDADGVPDEENPEWTAEDFKRAKGFKDLPKELQKGLLALKKRGRPKVAAPKQVKSFKLSPDLIAAIVSSGKGYNVRVEAVLREAIAKGRI